MDSSALVKLLADEAESAALHEATAGRRLSASALVLVEVPRAAGRLAPAAFWSSSWTRLVERVRIVDIDRRLLARAAALQPPALRSLDAVHLATALAIPGLDAFVGYDARLQAAASAAGLVALSPGAVAVVPQRGPGASAGAPVASAAGPDEGPGA